MERKAWWDKIQCGKKRCLAVKGDLRSINKIRGGRSTEHKKIIGSRSRGTKKKHRLRVSNRIHRGGFTPWIQCFHQRKASPLLFTARRWRWWRRRARSQNEQMNYKRIFTGTWGLRESRERRPGEHDKYGQFAGQKVAGECAPNWTISLSCCGWTDGRTHAHTDMCVFLLLKGSNPRATVIEGKGHLFDKQKAPFTPHELRDP